MWPWCNNEHNNSFSHFMLSGILVYYDPMLETPKTETWQGPNQALTLVLVRPIWPSARNWLPTPTHFGTSRTSELTDNYSFLYLRISDSQNEIDNHLSLGSYDPYLPWVFTIRGFTTLDPESLTSLRSNSEMTKFKPEINESRWSRSNTHYSS